MSNRKLKLEFAPVFFFFSIAIALFFIFWILKESEDEMVNSAVRKYEQYLVEGDIKKGREFVKQVIPQGNTPLDPVWMPLIITQNNAYDRLHYYVRIIAGDPNRKKAYEIIRDLIKLAPEPFNDKSKPELLKLLASVEGVRDDYLDEYGLKLPEELP